VSRSNGGRRGTASALTYSLQEMVRGLTRLPKSALRCARKALLGLLLLTLLVTFSYAQEPHPQAPSADVAKLISYQGRVSRPDGTPVADGTYQMSFALYETPMGGGAVWSETQMILVQNGAFSALLGQAVAFDPTLWDGTPYWLETWVEGQVLSPRLAIASTPYAITILPGAVVQGDLDDHPILTIENESAAPAATGLQATTKIGHAVYGLSNDGIGVDGYSATFRGVNGMSESGDGVFGHAQGQGVGVRGLSHGGDGIQGIAETGPIGVRGVSQSGQTGVLGVSEGPPTVGDTAFGVAGHADDPNGIGVFGSSVNGWPIKGITPSEHPAIWGDNTGSGMGVFGTSIGGPGVRGKSVTEVGVQGQSESGIASVFGWSVNPVGVRGQSYYSDGVYGYSAEGRGVYGESANAAGVYGESINEPGVYGTSSNHEGVKGVLTTSNRETAAVLGENQSHGIGVKGTTDSDNYQVPAVVGENTGRGIGVKGTTSSEAANAPAILADNEGAGPGMRATTSSSAYFVAAVEADNTGGGMGLKATTTADDPAIAAVLASNDGTGYGVKGVTASDLVTISAILAENKGQGIGLEATTASEDATVAAVLSRNEGNGYGVKGVTASNLVTISAVLAENEGAGIGVRGVSRDAAGVRGESEDGPGVAASSSGEDGIEATTSSSDPLHAAVRATNTGQGFGVYATSQDNRGIGAITYSSLDTMSAIQGDNRGAGHGVVGKAQGSVSAVMGENASTGYGVYGESAEGDGILGITYASSSTEAGVLGENLGSGYGLRAWSGANDGVYAVTTASDAYQAGVKGVNTGGGFGVLGEAQDVMAGVKGYNSSTGTGVYGDSEDGHGVVGHTESSDSSDAGVLGINEGGGYGVLGDSDGPWGVAGITSQAWSSGQPLGQPFGVGGQANSSGGFGVTGLSYSGPAGVIGGTAWSSTSQVGSIQDQLPVGVAGVSWNGTGVYGSSQNHYGVVARTAYAAYALVSFGDLYISGNLWATGAKGGYAVDVALNDDTQALEAGDVVVVTGVAAPVIGDIPVLQVKRADTASSTAVIGVVDKHYSLEESEISARGEEAGTASSSSIALLETRPDESGQAEPSTEDNTGADEANNIEEELPLQEPRLLQEPAAPGEYVTIVTLGVYAQIKIDASYGAIQPGDLLVASPTLGHAMKAVDPRIGTVIGKALGTLSSGRGTIPVLVNLQ